MAASTLNLLSSTEALASRNTAGTILPPDTYSTAWTFNSGNGSFIIDDDRTGSLTPSYYGMKISPTDTNPVVISLQDKSVLGTQMMNQTNLVFSANINSDSQLSISANLVQQAESPASQLRTSQNIPGVWTAFRSNYFEVTTTGSTLGTADYIMHIQITISNHGGNPFHITTCALIDDFAFLKNNYVLTGRTYLPTFYWDIDGQQTNPTYPFFKLLDLMTTKSFEMLQKYANWFDFEMRELRAKDTGSEDWSKSTLTDPYYAQEAARPWLSQFIGTTTKSNVWATGTNANAAGGAASGAFESWISDEASYISWQLANGHYGLASGSRSAVIGAVQQVLSDTKTVALSPYAATDSGTAQAGSGSSMTLAATASALDDAYNNHIVTITGGTGVGQTATITDYVGSTKVASATFSTNPDNTSTYTLNSRWALLIRTLTSETPDATSAGDTSAPVLDAVELARPMGFSFYHAVETALYLTLNNMGIGRLNLFKLGT
ncbi:MAG: hypothetical protein CL489_00940 [Acidobacteria bacterium]|nr:hypothetical protein [Acidobacteriota bacterium]